MTTDTKKLTDADSIVSTYHQALPHGRDSQTWKTAVALVRENLDLLKEVMAELKADSTEYKQYESAVSAAEDAVDADDEIEPSSAKFD